MSIYENQYGNPEIAAHSFSQSKFTCVSCGKTQKGYRFRLKGGKKVVCRCVVSKSWDNCVEWGF